LIPGAFSVGSTEPLSSGTRGDLGMTEVMSVPGSDEELGVAGFFRARFDEGGDDWETEDESWDDEEEEDDDWDDDDDDDWDDEEEDEWDEDDEWEEAEADEEAF
jgi:hypothetical protein